VALTVVGGLAALHLGGACAAPADIGPLEEAPPAAAVATGSARFQAGEDLVETRWGPLSSADRVLLVKVRQAGLWEIPVGREAKVRAARAKTRSNLGELARQHEQLDADVRSVATRLRVVLPDEPTEEQQGWIAEISAETGTAYDRTAVKRLRQAHGGVFPVIAQVRATTRNTLIRDFAERAARFVNDHMDMLEATGLVDASAVPPAPDVGAPPDVVPSGEPAPSAPPATRLLDDEPADDGPLSAADLDLLAKVRQAGLWEIPVGREAAARAVGAATRKNLGEIARQHELLDADVRSVAARLRVPLPDLPTEEQQGWIMEIFVKTGEDFDRTAVTRMRVAHGKVFPVIAQVRATTQNAVIRDFADLAAQFVRTHMALLEGTGLVGPTALPTAPEVTSAPEPVPDGEPAPSAPPATSLF
jgi:predicted outer membrane protein